MPRCPWFPGNLLNKSSDCALKIWKQVTVLQFFFIQICFALFMYPKLLWVAVCCNPFGAYTLQRMQAS